jgi:hypothetical protein
MKRNIEELDARIKEIEDKYKLPFDPDTMVDLNALSWSRGYARAILDYGIWNDGTQHIGCLQKPVREIIKELADAIGVTPDELT